MNVKHGIFECEFALVMESGNAQTLTLMKPNNITLTKTVVYGTILYARQPGLQV